MAPDCLCSGIMLLDKRHLVKNLSCISKKSFSFWRQGDPLPGADKDGDTEFCLELME